MTQLMGWVARIVSRRSWAIGARVKGIEESSMQLDDPSCSVSSERHGAIELISKQVKEGEINLGNEGVATQSS